MHGRVKQSSFLKSKMPFIMTKLLLAFNMAVTIAIAPICVSAQEVKDCSIEFLEDSSAGDQRRYTAFVFSNAPTVEDRLATAVYVAQNILERTNYHYIDVFLTPLEAPDDRSLLSQATASAVVRYTTSVDMIPRMDQALIAQVSDRPYSDDMWIYGLFDATEKAQGYLSIQDTDNTCNLDIPQKK